MSDEAPDELARAQARVGSVLREKWTLDKLLGVGGMGAVYAATHRNKKRGAVKLLHPELSAEPSVRQRFLREGYVANSVGHRGAVEVFDDDVAEDGGAYLVMELLEGESVEARWERKGRRLPVLEVLALVDQVLDTLTEAHAKDIVHRDVKPENLFLQKGGVLKVLDFGIARLREVDKSASTSTQDGSAMGTPAFMAPEQARGRWEEVDGRTDLWAVGASMFTLITGQYVHGGGTVNEVMARAVTQPPPSLGSVQQGAEPALVAFVDRAMAYLPKDRFQTAQEMQQALRELYHSLDGRREVRPAAPSAPDHGSAASLGAVVLVTAAAPGNATLTTGRAVVTSSDPQVPKPALPKWLPLAAGGAALLVAVLVFALSGGTNDEPASASGTPVGAALPAAPLTLVPPPVASAIAADAPSPPQPSARTVDLKSLPTLKSTTPPVQPPPGVAQPSKPARNLFKKRQ